MILMYQVILTIILCIMLPILLLSQNVFPSPAAATDNTPTTLPTTELAQLLQAPQQGVVRNKVAGYLSSHDSFGLRGASRVFQDVQYSKWAINDPKNEILYHAASEGDTNKVKLFLKIGANVNATVEGGRTPLFIASYNGREGVVEKLIAAKADVNNGNHSGTTPLYMASQVGHVGVVEILIKAGADVNKANKHGWTPLFIATQNTRVCVVQLLKAAGAIPEAGEDGP